MPQAAHKAMATFRVGVEDAVLAGDSRLPELRTSAGYRESINRYGLILSPHYEPEAIGEQAADHLLNPASHFAVMKAGREGVGGRFRFDIVLLTNGPAGKRGKARRRVDRHVVSVAQKRNHRDRARDQVAVRQHLHARVARAG